MYAYRYIYADGHAQECDSCGYTAPLAEFPRRSLAERDQRKLICEVCATTEIGSITDYASRSHDIELFRVVAQSTNLILDKMTGRFPTPPESDAS